MKGAAEAMISAVKGTFSSDSYVAGLFVCMNICLSAWTNVVMGVDGGVCRDVESRYTPSRARPQLQPNEMATKTPVII